MKLSALLEPPPVACPLHVQNLSPSPATIQESLNERHKYAAIISPVSKYVSLLTDKARSGGILTCTLRCRSLCIATPARTRWKAELFRASER